MTCTACGGHPKENTAKGFPKAVVEINNPETLVLLRKVVIPASMGDETAFPPAIGKYFNVLLHYEASGSNYLYSSDGIPTAIGANIPQEVLDRIEALEDGYDDLAEDYEQLQSEVGDVSEALSAETSARELADSNLQSQVRDVSEALSAETSARELADGNLQSQVGDVSEALSAETSARRNADIGLQGQIDAITSSSDVKDIVGTYTELQNYDTSTLGNDDIIKVLQDSTHNNAMTYYRWIISGGAGSWQYIGEEGPYYTKSETETLLNNKQDEITSSNKLLSDLVDDTNQTNKFVTENEKTTWNTEIENLQEEDELLKRNLQTTTGSGEEVTLEKTAELDFVKPPLPRGNTKQNTTTGKNLLPPLDSGSLNGLTFTTNSNGITTISGTTTSVTTYFKNVNKILPAGTYTLSINLSYTPPASSSQLILQDINNVRLATINLWTMTSKTFTLSADTEIKNYYFFSNSGIQHNGTISIQLEKGSTATSYEPYTGGPSPNPSYPQEVEVVTGNVGVTISNENNTENKTLPVSLGNIELCKIGDYQDYLYKNNGKWYVHKNIIKIDLSTITSYIHTPGWRNPTSFVADNVFYHEYSGYTTVASLFCNRLIADTPARITGSVVNAIGLGRNSSIYLSVEGITTSNALITYFSQNPTYLYAPLATPTDTEITDTTLISQLEEISKTLSYQGQTNITSNTIALFDVEAYQSTKLILEDISDELDTKVSLDEFYRAFPTDTASGAVASFTDGADDLPLKSLVVNIDPVQDLNGYSYPWPAGGGKNLFNGTFLQGYWAYADGTWVNSLNWITTEKIPCKASTSYTVSSDAKLTRWQGFVWYDSNGNYISTDNLQSNVNIGLTKTSPSNAAYLIFNIAGYPGASDTIAPSDVTHFQLEEGSSSTAYAPYSNICPISGWTGMQLNANGTVIPISWQTEAGTVYGGTLNVTTGVLTVNRAIVDLGAKNWYSSTAAGRTRFRTSITDIERISSPNIVAPMLCSKYPTKSANQTYQGTTGVSLQQNEADIYIYDPQTQSMTTTEFKSAMSGVQLCYKLATPQTYQLTPTEVTTLLGDNTIWADTGDTEVEYRADTKLYINKMI